MAGSARKGRSLETRLGYRFKNRQLLDRALTHSSVRANAKGGKGAQRSAQKSAQNGAQNSAESDNERLEFLGDRVLGLAIAELLNETFSTASEGDLARRYNSLVRGETCAEVARRWGLGEHMILSESEADSGGRDKETILADACEAVLAAVFLEAGFETARKIVRDHWAPLLDALPADPADAKSTLQEWAQAQRLPVPSYREVSREGPDHAPKFTAEVKLDGKRSATGLGASKRAAEQSAAANLLVREGVWRREKA